MKIRVRTILICSLGLALYMNQTCFAGKLSSALFWIASIFLLLLLFCNRNDIKFLIAGKKDFIDAIIIFLGISAVSILYNSFRYGENATWISSIKIWISYLVYFFGITLTCTLVPKQVIKRELHTIAYFFVYISFLPVLLGTFQAFFYEFVIDFSFIESGELRWLGRYYTLFLNPNGYSELLFIVFCLAQYLKIEEIGKKYSLTVFQVLCFINLCMTASRGTLVAVIVAWLVFDRIYFLRYRVGRYARKENTFYILKQGTKLFFCVMVLYFGCNYIPNIIPHNAQVLVTDTVQPMMVYAAESSGAAGEDEIIVRDYYEHGSDISNGRIEKWIYGIKTFLENPILGVGLYGDKFISCHNAYISILLAYGMMGFFAFAGVVLKVLNRIKINSSRLGTKKSIESYGILVSCGVGIMVMAVTNDLLIFTFEFPNLFFYYLIGYLMKKPEMEE